MRRKMRKLESVTPSTDTCPTEFVGGTCSVALLALKLRARGCLADGFGKISQKVNGDFSWVELDGARPFAP